MKKEFIPHAQALELKELGFNKPCVGYYENDVLILCYDSKQDYELLLCYDSKQDYELLLNCAAPLYQQAFRWFREKYNLYQDISTFVWDYDKKQLGFTIRTYLNPLNLDTEKKVHLEVYESYEEAELECLKKLIEIVKNK
jgi:hypothetical protein